jgi:hypothetical protein
MEEYVLDEMKAVIEENFPNYSVISLEVEQDLKPCPFCGEISPVRVCHASEINDGNISDTYTVICDYRNGGCGSCSGYRESKLGTIDIWNSRCANH